MSILKVFGPPGTGKTTYLLNQVESELEAKTEPIKIGYFAFTRKAAYEAKERAVKRFPHLNVEKDFPWFRTLHSLAFRCLGMTGSEMMKAANYNEFAKKFGLVIAAEDLEDEDFTTKADNPVLNEINLARIRGIDLLTHYNRSRMSISWHYFDYIARGYKDYKLANSLYDFTDLLEMIVLEPDRLPRLDVLIVDECQDLSRLQWDIVRDLTHRSDRILLAGDDDQAIYTWAGADVDSFMSFPGDILILGQSYRVPAKVHDLANRIVKRIQHRQDKTWEAREEEGQVAMHNHFFEVDVTQGEWLVMASANYMLNDVHGWLKSQGLLFERFGQRSISESILAAVMAWESLRKGNHVAFNMVQQIYRYLPMAAVKRGYKSLPNAKEDASYSMQILQDEWGLNPDVAGRIWHEALTKIPDEKREYIIALLRRGTRLMDKPQIKLSTIHAAKGGEADHVMLLTDLSAKSAQEYQSNPDDINRLLYVGLTRTRKSLHLVRPQHYDRAFRL